MCDSSFEGEIERRNKLLARFPEIPLYTFKF